MLIQAGVEENTRNKQKMLGINVNIGTFSAQDKSKNSFLFAPFGFLVSTSAPTNSFNQCN